MNNQNGEVPREASEKNMLSQHDSSLTCSLFFSILPFPDMTLSLILTFPFCNAFSMYLPSRLVNFIIALNYIIHISS